MNRGDNHIGTLNNSHQEKDKRDKQCDEKWHRVEESKHESPIMVNRVPIKS